MRGEVDAEGIIPILLCPIRTVQLGKWTPTSPPVCVPRSHHGAEQLCCAGWREQTPAHTPGVMWGLFRCWGPYYYLWSWYHYSRGTGFAAQPALGDWRGWSQNRRKTNKSQDDPPVLLFCTKRAQSRQGFWRTKVPRGTQEAGFGKRKLCRKGQNLFQP